MNNSRFFQINEFILLEYIYSNEIINNLNAPPIKVDNFYTNEVLFLNDRIAQNITNNTLDNSSTEKTQFRNEWAYLDLDVVSPFIQSDVNLTQTNLTGLLNPFIKYDTIRIHFSSGFFLDQTDGFIVKIFIRDFGNNIINLASNTFYKIFDSLKINDKAFILDERVYDRYYEFKIPSTSWILNEQTSNPLSTNTLGKQLSIHPNGISNQTQIYFILFDIKETKQTNGKLIFNTETFDLNKIITISPTDFYSSLNVVLNENSEFNFIEFYATWNNGFIGEYISNLNSIGVQFDIIHQIDVFELVGTSWKKTASYNILQNNDFDKPNIFRPILINSPYTSKFSIDYTMIFRNKHTNEQILRRASITSNNIFPYFKKIERIDTNIDIGPLKVYNKKIKLDNSIKLNNFFVDLNQKQTIIRNQPIFYEKANILINSKNISELELKTQIRTIPNESSLKFFLQNSKDVFELNDFDNILFFKMFVKQDDGGLMSLDLTNEKQIELVFYLDDNSKVFFQLSKKLESNLKEGEVFFEVDSQNSKKILSGKNRNFALILRNGDFDNVLFSGKFRGVFDDENKIETAGEIKQIDLNKNEVQITENINIPKIVFDSLPKEIKDNIPKIAETITNNNLPKTNLNEVKQNLTNTNFNNITNLDEILKSCVKSPKK